MSMMVIFGGECPGEITIIITIHMTIIIVVSSWFFRAIARVHPVHLMNADSAPDDCQHSDQAKQLGQ